MFGERSKVGFNIINLKYKHIHYIAH